MDYKSPKGWNAAVGPLSVLDDHSRYLLVLQAVWSNHGAHVRERLETAFGDCGVPEAMLMDHGVPWWSATAPTGATGLRVWLMQQGIKLHWSGYRHPQTQGKVERFHGSLERALQARGAPRKEPQAWLDEYRWEYNRCGRTNRWACGHPPACGARVSAVISRNRLAGNTRPERRCANWMVRES